MTSINKKLTNRQNLFVNEIARGNTQRQAYLLAYPKSKNWNIQTVDVRASTLMKNKAIMEELRKIYREEKSNILWNREKSTETLLNLLENAKHEQQIIINCYNEELNIRYEQFKNIEDMLLKSKSKIEKLSLLNDLHNVNNEICMHTKKILSNHLYTSTIHKCIKILNKMYGLENVECENYNMGRALTIDELKELANNVIKQNEIKNL